MDSKQIVVTETPAQVPGACRRLHLHATRQTDTGTASVDLTVSLNARGTGYTVSRCRNLGRGWTRPRFNGFLTEVEALAAARRVFARELAWLAGVAPVRGRGIDAVAL